MIYIILSDHWAEMANIPQFMLFSKGVKKIPFQLMAAADYVFHFDETGKTVYYKTRTNIIHQYTDEEKVVLKLKSVLI